MVLDPKFLKIEKLKRGESSITIPKLVQTKTVRETVYVSLNSKNKEILRNLLSECRSQSDRSNLSGLSKKDNLTGTGFVCFT